MSVAADPAPEPETLVEAVDEANRDRKTVAPHSVAKRLRTAATLLDRQEARASVALLQDTEALDSEIRPPHVQVIPGAPSLFSFPLSPVRFKLSSSGVHTPQFCQQPQAASCSRVPILLLLLGAVAVCRVSP